MPKDVATFPEKEALGYIKVGAAVRVDPVHEPAPAVEVADAPPDEIAVAEADEITSAASETPEDPGNWQRLPRRRNK